MKRTVSVIALLVLSIGIPILAKSNDSLSTESENPVLQKQELKLPWYKNMNYTLGYNSDSSLLTSGSPSKDILKGQGIPFWRKLDYGIGYTSGLGRIVEIQLEPLSPNLWGFFVWNNIVDINLQYYLNRNWILRLEIGYLWTKGWIKPVESFNFISFGKTDLVNLLSPSIIYLKDNKTKIGIDYRLTKILEWNLYGKEIGIFSSFTPVKRNLTSTLKYDISLTARFSFGKDLYIIYYKSRRWFDYDVLEIYLKIDFYHIYNNITKKERRNK